MLAILMILMCIPSTLTSTMATGPMWGGFGRPGGGNNVLTNVSVSFYDSKFNAITKAESGGLFYLAVQLAGNNVNQNQKDNFRLEITDENLLLPNFAGNGFVDGATYNGFTLHVKADGTRYLDYSIANGETKMIRLQAKFANGTTPNGAKETVKLIRTSSGQSVSNTITAKSSLGWSQNKSQDKSFLSGDAFKNGSEVTVNYTLTATPNNVNKSKGAWFASGLHFVDTLKIPDGLNAQADLEKVLKATGFDYEIIKADGTTFDFWVYSKDESKEMDSVNITLPVTFTCDKPTDSIKTDVKIDNTVAVTVTGVGDDKEQNVGNSNVSLTVDKPTTPAPDLEISKGSGEDGSNYHEISYDDASDWTEGEDGKTKTRTVTYTVKIKNKGDAIAENVVLTETPPSGVTITKVTRKDGGTCEWNKEDNTIVIGDIPADKKDVEIEITATLATATAGTFMNKVTENVTKREAYDTIKVNKKQANITAQKIGYATPAGKNEKRDYYNAGDEIHYTITVWNSGEVKGDALIEDVLSDVAGVDWKTVKINGGVEEALTDTNSYKATVTVPAKVNDVDGQCTIELIGTVKSDSVPDKIKNNVTVNKKPYYGNELHKADSKLDVAKTANLDQIAKNGTAQEVKYVITISNTGELEATDLEIIENPDEGISFTSDNIKVTSDKGSKTLTADYTDGKITVKNGAEALTSLEAGETITLTITAKITPTVDTYTNAVTVSAGDKEVTKSKTVYAKEPPKELEVKKKLVSVNGDDENISENTEISNGDELVYEAVITNKSNSKIESVSLYDGGNTLHFSDLEVVAGGSDEMVLYYTPSSSNEMSQVTIGKVNLQPEESVTIRYKATPSIDVSGNNDTPMMWQYQYRWQISVNNPSTQYKEDS
ncbi:MAG: DUF11 domain-containing protein, partial [Oscillospiraceae bacterium]|nr:DUF11 domain-containing protein [Oscillospiraceae bacterium]